VGGNPLFYLQVVFLVLLFFIAFKKNQKYKNILAETIRGTKFSSPILGKIVTRFRQNVTRFCPTSEAPQNFSKLKLGVFQHCQKRDTLGPT